MGRRGQVAGHRGQRRSHDGLAPIARRGGLEVLAHLRAAHADALAVAAVDGADEPVLVEAVDVDGLFEVLAGAEGVADLQRVGARHVGGRQALLGEAPVVREHLHLEAVPEVGHHHALGEGAIAARHGDQVARDVALERRWAHLRACQHVHVEAAVLQWRGELLFERAPIARLDVAPDASAAALGGGVEHLHGSKELSLEALAHVFGQHHQHVRLGQAQHGGKGDRARASARPPRTR
jgi:hypothetical protein